jgi:hypothetical protein
LSYQEIAVDTIVLSGIESESLSPGVCHSIKRLCEIPAPLGFGFGFGLGLGLGLCVRVRARARARAGVRVRVRG